MTITRAQPWPTAGSIMQTELVTIAASTPLVDVERLLSEHRIGGAPVTDEAGHIVGVISLRDLVEKYVEDPDQRPVRGHGFYEISDSNLSDEDFAPLGLDDERGGVAGDVMTAEVHAVPHDTALPDLAKKMVELRLHRVLVTRDRHHVGLVSSFDILRALGEAN